MSPEFWRDAVQVTAWAVALAWCVRLTDALKHLPFVTNLADLAWDVEPEGAPGLVVVVPGRNEAAKIAATLDTLTQQDYAGVRVLAVNDRSTDETGAIMDRYALQHPHKLTVLHIEELPPGWLGKTHAMAQAFARVAESGDPAEYVLFTDADILFSPSILRRSLAYARSERADHLVVMPTMMVKSRGEGLVLAFFQVLPLWATRLWKVADPKARHDVIGVGAFNMLRREALVELGGWAPQRLSVLEDITLGRRVKVAGMRQRVAFAPGMVLVHWAEGAMGLVRGMSKNFYSGVNFRAPFAVLILLWIVLFFLAPLAGLFTWGTVVPCLLILVCISVAYRMYGTLSWTPGWYFWTYPAGAAMFCYALGLSMVTVWKDGGVRWRGTLYPLRELRQHNNPFKWRVKR